MIKLSKYGLYRRQLHLYQQFNREQIMRNKIYNKQMKLKQKNDIIDYMVSELRLKKFDYFICHLFCDYCKDRLLNEDDMTILFPELMIVINNVRHKHMKKDNMNFEYNALHYGWKYRYANRIRLLLNVKRRINK